MNSLGDSWCGLIHWTVGLMFRIAVNDLTTCRIVCYFVHSFEIPLNENTICASRRQVQGG